MSVAGFGISFLFIFIILGIISLAIPVAMGVYVYKDAKSRGMNAVLWTVVAILVPSFIGLIIYLILRNEHSVNSCPKCGKNVSKDFSVCPECGYSLKQLCPNCSQPLSYDWNICPNCSAPVPEYIKVENPVKPKKDKGLKILLAIIMAVVVLFVGVFVAIGFIFMHNTDSDTVFTDEIVSANADIIIDTSEEYAWVEIDIDGYTDVIRSADIVFYADGKALHSTGISIPDGEAYFESPLFVEYPFFETLDSEYIVVTVSDANGVIAESDELPLDYETMFFYALKIQGDKLVVE